MHDAVDERLYLAESSGRATGAEPITFSPCECDPSGVSGQGWGRRMTADGGEDAAQSISTGAGERLSPTAH